MALIICTECGKEISDKAKCCVHCGCPIPEPFVLKTMLRTTIDELAALTDELPLDGKIVFTTEDPDELKFYEMQPSEYNVIGKTNLMYESYYVIMIGRIGDHCTVAKDIYLLADGNVSDEDDRIEGIRSFLEEYYNIHCTPNEKNQIYMIPSYAL